MRIDVERIKALKEEIAAINRHDLAKFELYENGERVFIPASKLYELSFTGLTNFTLLKEYFFGDPNQPTIRTVVFEDKSRVVQVKSEDIVTYPCGCTGKAGWRCLTHNGA